MANKRDSHQQQNQSQKKATSDGKKSEADDSATTTGSTPNPPSDVYEFVSTPKHSSCSSSSGDERPNKTSEDKSGTENETLSKNLLQKRMLADKQEQAEDQSAKAEEEAKRKKRKETELKDGNKSAAPSGTNRVTSRVGQKPPGPASKTMGLINKCNTSSQVDRKSPTELTSKPSDGATEDEDSKDGPKVPPLKIMIPQQGSGSTETQEAQNVSQRAVSKPAPSRNHPYVVASSNSNDGVSDSGARGQSPSADSNKSDDAGKPSGKSKEPRVLRSSRRDAKDDRGSNNSSPQLPASSTPSPAGQTGENSCGNESETQQNTVSSSASSAANNSAAPAATSSQSSSQQLNSVELHPRKRKIKASSREPTSVAPPVDVKDSNSKDGQDKSESEEQPFSNCYQMYIDLRKQIGQRHRSLRPVEPRPLKGLEDYLMNRRTYLLQGKSSIEPNIVIPPLLPAQLKDTFTEQEKERHKLKLRHIVEKEKLVLSKEQEILRVHCKAAQIQANQSHPFSVCAILKDEEVYDSLTPEHEERYNNRSFFKELKDLDDKYDKIKEAMITRHTNEAESLMAVQKMDWGWKMKEFALCEYRTNPEIEELHVPMIDVSDVDAMYTTPSIIKN